MYIQIKTQMNKEVINMTSINIRIDDDVKYDAENLFQELGMSLSGAINVFLRQAIRKRAIPFQIEAKTDEEKYNEYFNEYNVKILKESIAQAERGEIITFSIDELFAMEDGEIPQRAIDFLEKHMKSET